MADEVKLFHRYLRLNKKLAFTKNWDKQRKIVQPIYSRMDYSKFDFTNNQEWLKEDFETFQKHSTFDVESLESEQIRNQLKVNLQAQMLKKKPHYRKYFSDDELEDVDSHTHSTEDKLDNSELAYNTMSHRLTAIFACQ